MARPIEAAGERVEHALGAAGGLRWDRQPRGAISAIRIAGLLYRMGLPGAGARRSLIAGARRELLSSGLDRHK